MKHKNTRKRVEKSSVLHPAWSFVLIWRDKSQSWAGPFSFININGETVVVELPQCRKIFPTRVVKTTNGRKRNDENGVFFMRDEYTTKESMELFGTTKTCIPTKAEVEKVT